MQKKLKVYSLELTKEEKDALKLVSELLKEIDKCSYLEWADSYGEFQSRFDSIEEMLEDYCIQGVIDGLLNNEIEIYDKNIGD